MKKQTEICCECGESVKQGSGRFANRVPVLDDYETSKEMGREYPKGGFICDECWDNDEWLKRFDCGVK